ncbi:MAG: hypothetical protein K2Q01_11805 [Rickettsiales bacterium]|nr:hypothetical protein [Rickettsiales bacterium]
MMRFWGILALLALAACQPKTSQDVYDYSEVGISSVAEFGTVVAVREVQVKGKNTHSGAAAGAAGGAIGGYQYGSGYGQAVTTVGGALLGAAVGQAAEQAVADYTALEYTVVRENGKTLTVVQNPAEGERVFKPGERVLVQMTGSYQRILPADHMPAEIKKPQGIEIQK